MFWRRVLRPTWRDGARVAPPPPPTPELPPPLPVWSLGLPGRGKRFDAETLKIQLKGKNVADLLEMEVDEAASFFQSQPRIRRILESLSAVGLGYLKLGQASNTLSGGESQRVKLATELVTRETGGTLYILDEPTTGLHFEDIRRLLTVFQALVEGGNTLVV